MNSFGWLDIVLFLGLVQGIFLVIGLNRVKNRNVKANRILSVILFLATTILLARFAFTQYFTPWMWRWIVIPDTVILAIGPLIYHYVNEILYSKPLKKIFYLHFIPFFLYLSLGVFLSLQSPENFSEIASFNWISVTFFVVEGFAIVFNIYLTARCLLILKQGKKIAAETLSFGQQYLKYLNNFSITILFVLIVWFIIFVLSKFFLYQSNYFNYNTVWISIPIIIYIISYYSLRQPELFRIPVKKQIQESKQRLDEKAISELDKKLKHLMEVEKVYLNNYLTLKELADLAASSTNNISWLLNEVHKKNFYDYVNSYRLRAFIQKVENNEHKRHTILALAMDAGFNSKSTFNSIFKSEMNQTPSAFIKGMA